MLASYRRGIKTQITQKTVLLASYRRGINTNHSSLLETFPALALKLPYLRNPSGPGKPWY